MLKQRSVKKAVIPAAGLGTRFLPVTKTIPKEMLPIIDKPAIHYIVEEAVAAGIEDILIVTSKRKQVLEQYFHQSAELEDRLKKQGKYERYHQLMTTLTQANIHFTYQPEPKGLGDAIGNARTFVGEEPFAVLLGDNVMRDDPPCTHQLVDAFQRTGQSISALKQVADADIEKYGIIDPGDIVPGKPQLMTIRSMEEKPTAERALSNYAILGRHVLVPEIFDELVKTPPDKNGEIQLTDALQRLNRYDPVYGYLYSGNHYDIGDKFGYWRANMEFAHDHPQLADHVHQYVHHATQNMK